MRIYKCLARVLSAIIALSLPAIAAAQTPVALPYTSTTFTGGLAPNGSYTSGTTICPGTTTTKATSAAGDNCAAISGILGSGARAGAAVDPWGNVILGDDVGTKVIHMIDANTGLMTVVAGGGTVCSASGGLGKVDSAGDGCLASTATALSTPRGIGIDAYGNVVIPDYGGNAIHLVCRVASPLCTTGTPAPTAATPIQIRVGYMGLVGGCASATGSGLTSGTGLDGTPGFTNSVSTVSGFNNSGACSTTSITVNGTAVTYGTKGQVAAPRGAWGDAYGNIYFAETNTSRTRVILGPYTSSYFSGTNPLYAALEVSSNWTYSTSGGAPTGTLRPGYAYTIANVDGSSTSTSTATSTAGGSCASSQALGTTVIYSYSGSASAIDTHADGCPFFDSAVTASSGYTDTVIPDAAGNAVFTDPGSSAGLLRVLFVQGWSNLSVANSAGASGSVAAEGVAMYNAILKNNPGITPTPGYIYALAGGVGQGQNASSFPSTTNISTSPTLGNATKIGSSVSSSSITKLAISPQGNIYISDGTAVLFYDIYNGSIRTLLTAGSFTSSTKGSACPGGGGVAKSAFLDGCPISQVGFGANSQAAGNLGIGVDAQGDVYIEDSIPTLTVIRKVLAQGTGVASTGTLNALASSVSTAYPWQSLGTTQTQTFKVHFPTATAASASVTNSTNASFSYGTPNCTWFSTTTNPLYDNSMDCTVAVSYTPSATGPQSAAMTIMAAGGESITLNLGGTVSGSALAVDNASLAGSSALVTAQLFNGNTPYAVATDQAGNVYAAVNAGGSYAIVESLAASPGSLLTLASELSEQPTALALDQTGNIFYLLSGTATIQELAVSAAGGTNTYTNSTLTYYPSNLGTANPTALAVDAAGDVLVADKQSGVTTIYKIPQSATTSLMQAACAAVFASGSAPPTLCQTTLNQTTATGVSTSPDAATPLAFQTVDALAADPAGNIYVADTGAGSVFKLTPIVTTGIYDYTETTAASAMADGLATDAAGDWYALGTTGVTLYPLSGASPVSVYGTASSPHGVAVDGAGNVYIADAGSSYVTQVQRGNFSAGNAINFSSNYSIQFAATLTNTGNAASAAQSVANGSQAPDFNLGGSGASGCSFPSGNLLAAMTAGQACTMTASFPAIGSGPQADNIVFGFNTPVSGSLGELTLTGVADLTGFNTTVAIGAASTSPIVYSTGAEVTYPITVTANGTSTDGSTTITSGPTTANFVNVSVDGKPPVQYNFTSTNGLAASFTLTLSGLNATTTPATQHSFIVSFPQQGSFLSSLTSLGSIAINQQPTILNWTPGAASQQVSAPIGSSVLNAAITTPVAGQIAYAIGAYPSCSSATAATGSTPIDASTYLAIGTYTLYAVFCPTDAVDYAVAQNTTSYSVTQASSVAAVGASTNVVASDGTGNYTSLSAALAALPATGGTIYIAPGTYYGQNAISYPNVSLRGLGGDPTKVVLTAEDGAFSSPYTGYLGTGTGAGNANAQGDQGSATLDVSKSVYMGQTAGSTSSPIGVTTASQNTPTNFYAEYLTVQNTWNTDNFTKTTFQVSNSNCTGGFAATALSALFYAGTQCNSQALALWITGDQAILNNVNLTSLQDTLYAGSQGASGSSRTPARQYMWKGTITGTVDYVFGDAAMVFDHTNIFTAWHTTTATGTETIEAQNKQDQTGSSNDYLSGYICNSCILMSQSTGMTNLDYGRPYGPFSTWIMLNNYVDQVNPAGWIEFSGDTNLPTSTYAEFNSIPYTDPPVGTAPYPAGLFYENSAVIPGFTGTPGYAVIPTGGNTGAGVTGVREVTSQDPGTLEASNPIKTQLTAGEATLYAPQTFLSTTVPLQPYYGFSEGWNPQAVLASRVNAFVPASVLSPIAYGSSVTILGRPQTPGAGVIPTGTYQFLDGGSPIASGSLDASGEAYLTTSSLAPGTHNISFAYSGDSNFTGSTSAPYVITVLAQGTPTSTTALSVVNVSSTFGKAITGTVAVNPTAATGTVTLYLDNAAATTCTLASGSCAFSFNGPAVGSHSLYAAYAGNGSLGGSDSTVVTLNVAVPAATGDSTRNVTEPSFPATCQSLTAALTTDPAIQDLDASVDNPPAASNPDGARIQAALNACSGTGHAVELSMDSTGTYNAFLTGPLTMPSNVTLLVDPGVTVYFSRNVQDYDPPADFTNGVLTNPSCGTVASSGSCLPLIDVPGSSTNVGIMGYGKLDGRAKDLLFNSFTTTGFAMPSTPTWWNIANQANSDGSSQQNPRFIEMDNNSSNITLYKITVLNAPMFHVATGGSVNNLTIWDIKISSPTFTNNTDGIDPGDVTNATIANNWVSDGDDDVAVGGAHGIAQNISVINNHFYAGHGESIGSYTGCGGTLSTGPGTYSSACISNILYDNNMLAGDNVSGAGSAINQPMTINTTNYPANYADGNSTAIRIKTANDRGALVTGIQYSNSCFLNHKADLLFTPYYSSGDSTNEIPSYTNILLQNLVFMNSASSSGSVELDGEYNTDNNSPTVINPLGITLDNVTFPSALSSLVNNQSPSESSTTSSAWGSNHSGGTGQYVNLTVGPGQVSTNFLSAYINLVNIPANNDTLANNVSQPALNPPNCVFTYIAPELTGPTGVPQTITYGSTANVDVILMPIVSGAAFPTGNFTVTDTTTGNSFTGVLTTNTDTHVLTIPASDLTGGTHTFTATYLGDSNYTIPASYQTFGSYNITVNPAAQTIAFGTIPTQAPGVPLALTATASSNLPVSYTSSTTSICTVSGNIATFLQPGICTITASQAGNANYLAATPVAQTFSVISAPPVTLIVTAAVTGSHSAGYTLNITVKNTGTATASNVVLTAATLGTTSGSPLPQTGGNIAAGGTATFTLSVPGSVGLDGAGVPEKCSGTYTGGSFGGSMRSLTLP